MACCCPCWQFHLNRTENWIYSFLMQSGGWCLSLLLCPKKKTPEIRYHATSRRNFQQLTRTRLFSTTYKFIYKIWKNINTQIHSPPYIFVMLANYIMYMVFGYYYCIWHDQTIIRLHLFHCEIVTFILHFIVFCSSNLINFNLSVITCAIRWRSGGSLWDKYDDFLNEFRV